MTHHTSWTCFSDSAAPIPVLLDVDNALGMVAADVDDGVAVALAVASNALDVRGICTCPGNCSAVESAENTRRLLEGVWPDGRPYGQGKDMGRPSDIPVAVGRDEPLFPEMRDRRPHRNFMAAKAHGKGGAFWKKYGPARSGIPWGSVPSGETGELLGSDCLGQANSSSDTNRSGSTNNSADVSERNAMQGGDEAVELIIRTAREAASELEVVCLGTLTNLALALERAPDIAGCIRRVVHMGGVFTPWRDDQMDTRFTTPDIPEEIWRQILRFNTWYDPEASSRVFASGLPVLVIPANVTSQAFLRQSHLAALVGGGPGRRWIVRRLASWLDWSQNVRNLPGAHMHDPMALAALLHPEFFRVRTMCVDLAGLLHEQSVFLQRCRGAPPIAEGRDMDSTVVSDWAAETDGGVGGGRVRGEAAPARDDESGKCFRVQVAVWVDVPKFEQWLVSGLHHL